MSPGAILAAHSRQATLPEEISSTFSSRHRGFGNPTIYLRCPPPPPRKGVNEVLKMSRLAQLGLSQSQATKRALCNHTLRGRGGGGEGGGG